MPGQGGQNKVTGMEKIITKPGQAPVAHFLSGLDECEKKTVVWEVQNLVELLGLPMPLAKKMNGITFDAGHSIGIPATWQFCFFRFELRDFQRIGYFFHLSPESKAKVVKASCFISFSCEGEIIGVGDVFLHEVKSSVMTVDGGGFLYPPARVGDYVTDTDILQKTDNGRKALKVTLTLKVFSNKDSVEVPKEGLLENEVISDFGNLLESGDGTDSADVEISVPSVLGGQVDASSYKRKVHKCILMTRSPVFSKMFAKESEMVEAKTGKVVIKDLSPKGLGVFLHYIYTGKVLDEWVKVAEEILNASEKYDLGRLKQYCAHNIMSAVTTSNALEMYQLAKLHKLSFAKSAIAEFISKNTEAVLDVEDDDN